MPRFKALQHFARLFQSENICKINAATVCCLAQTCP